MSDIRLKEMAGLNLSQALVESWAGFSMREITGRLYYWLAVSSGAEAALGSAVRKHLGCGVPATGQYVDAEGKGDSSRLAWAGLNQYLASVASPMPEKAIAAAGSLTEQSDGWVGLRLEGPRARNVLEKVCSLDLEPQAFTTGSCARVPIEGMHGLLLCEDPSESCFALYVQRSSARSLVECLRHAAFSSCGERQRDATGEDGAS